ncbi:YveK family protein [Paenibacillus hexagrammi]|uniref:Wzz/FepE/Etk N-terminal domain-containing protein n=1 Tax=Paenibacillus hexagrammi TaxID=2908839 RepID=A0ABY3SM68_9BACL|nr:Wzz/FepE/Etk N-terminal domain-containing protein [Paenibacillus sp. YPD9-1]UJF34314.1 Wzz/FepE/Etk N-terminal domain-containing protein [Paenibacillus sp. YPD9-1]
MEFELREYLQIVWRKLWLIISLVVIACVITGIYSYTYIQPIYSASAKLIVNKSSEHQGVQYIDTATINASILLVNTYKEIIKTPSIMDKVVEKYPDIKLSSEQLSRKISINSANETQVITIVVNDSSYQMAAKIVNAVAEVFKEEIPNIMNVDNVTILNKAKGIDNPAPINAKPQNNIIISFLVSLMISLGIVFLLEYLNDTIKTEKDVENYLGIPTLISVSKMKMKDVSVSSSKRQSRGGEASVSVNQ